MYCENDSILFPPVNLYLTTIRNHRRRFWWRWSETWFELLNIQHALPLLRYLLGVRHLHHLTAAQGKHGVPLLSHHSSWGDWDSWGHWHWSMFRDVLEERGGHDWYYLGRREHVVEYPIMHRGTPKQRPFQPK